MVLGPHLKRLIFDGQTIGCFQGLDAILDRCDGYPLKNVLKKVVVWMVWRYTPTEGKNANSRNSNVICMYLHVVASFSCFVTKT